MDGLMIACFVASTILRFLLPEVDFYVVRLMYCITLMLFYFRTLRYGYILKQLGPRIITIRAMVRITKKGITYTDVLMIGRLQRQTTIKMNDNMNVKIHWGCDCLFMDY